MTLRLTQACPRTPGECAGTLRLACQSGGSPQSAHQCGLAHGLAPIDMHTSMQTVRYYIALRFTQTQ